MHQRKRYEKSFEDQLDWTLLGQLYGAVSQISKFCFEIKKFCVTAEVLIVGLLTKFSNEHLDSSIFVAGIIIPLAFWFVDAVGYYYQKKLRGLMDNICATLIARNRDPVPKSSDVEANRAQEDVEANRALKGWFKRAVRAGFNHSMWTYAILLLLDIAAWILFAIGRIR
jgi:hypothetical protein